MAEIKTIGAGLDPDDLWRNFFWLRDRVTKLEEEVRRLRALLQDQPKPSVVG